MFCNFFLVSYFKVHKKASVLTKEANPIIIKVSLYQEYVIRTAIMTLLILSNPTKKQCVDYSENLAKELRTDGFDVYTSEDACKGTPELIVIAGGDGTVLRYTETIAKYSAPVLGINFGHRGYLTACEPGFAREKILEITKGGCRFESRMLYEGEIWDKKGELRESFLGLNEAVLSRGALCRAVDFTLHINGNPVMSFPADGVIVATPTGSTAYNFSASGPILMPEAENLVITPICASALLRTSIVTSANDTVELSMSKDRLCEAEETPYLVADGFKKYAVDFGDRVTVRRSDKIIKIYGGEKGDFLRVLQEKMK